MRALPTIGSTFVLAIMLILASALPAEESGWIELTASARAREAWEKVTEDWLVAESVELDAQNARRLTAKPGDGILVNTPKSRAHNLATKQKFTDLEAHVEFLIPKGSNSGVKMMGLYEIQILDSHGKKDLSGDSCGGVYPRAEEKPVYHHIDKGVAPKTNAAKPAGEWQTLDIIFQAPRFDRDEKKTANARFLKVILNGQVVHEDVDLPYPTGAAWRLQKEKPTGPFFLQADHGPVAFRNVRVRPYTPASK